MNKIYFIRTDHFREIGIHFSKCGKTWSFCLALWKLYIGFGYSEKFKMNTAQNNKVLPISYAITVILAIIVIVIFGLWIIMNGLQGNMVLGK